MYRLLKLIEQKTRFAVANSGYFTKYLMERAIKKSQTLETGLQIASDLLIDSVHSRNLSLRRLTNRRVCIRLYAKQQMDLHVVIIAAGARLCATWRHT